MPPPQADGNLLFGILALQRDFISRDALVAAMHAWVLDKGRPLGQILWQQGALSEEHLALLEAMVQAHIKQHDNDPQQSLAAVSSLRSVRSCAHRPEEFFLDAALLDGHDEDEFRGASRPGGSSGRSTVRYRCTPCGGGRGEPAPANTRRRWA